MYQARPGFRAPLGSVNVAGESVIFILRHVLGEYVDRGGDAADVPRGLGEALGLAGLGALLAAAHGGLLDGKVARRRLVGFQRTEPGLVEEDELVELVDARGDLGELMRGDARG